MENSARKRTAMTYTVHEAQWLFDEIPSDTSETTEEGSSDDEELISTLFLANRVDREIRNLLIIVAFIEDWLMTE